MARKPFFREFDGWWYAQIRVGTNRKQVKLAKGKENEQQAYQAFCRLMADHEGEAPAPAVISVAELCDFFLDHAERHTKPNTYQGYFAYLQDFCNVHGRHMAVDIRPFHVSRWLDSHETWKGSRCNAIEALKRAYSWATGEGLLVANPIQSIKKPPKGKRSRVLTTEEQAEILMAIPDERFKRFVWAMQETGCRPSEVASITAAQVNFEQGLWILEEHKTVKKTNRPRIVYLTPPMIELCKELAEKRPSGPLFRNRLGKRYSKNAVVCRFRRLRELLPHLKHFVCYSLRHSYATKALVNGVGIAQVAELLGHTSTDMVMRHYGHLAQQVSHMKGVLRYGQSVKLDMPKFDLRLHG